MKSQRGFTLLELMVAMAIFAMLSVAGWQVFDSVNRARERAQFHADNLAVLQYAATARHGSNYPLSNTKYSKYQCDK